MIAILNEINSFLGYLNINSTYLNKLYTVISAFPLFFLIKSLIDMNKSNMMSIAFLGYVLATISIFYFLILNFMYYFFGKNTKLDITQLMAKKLPDEMFTSDMNTVNNNNSALPDDVTKINIEYVPGYSIKLKRNIEKLIENDEITTQDYKKNNSFRVPANTLYPYYYVTHDKDKLGYYAIKIGTDLENFETIGYVYAGREKLVTLGLFITGGPFYSNEIEYNQAYGLKLIIKKRKKESN